MEMSADELFGEVLARFQDPEDVLPVRVWFALNHAQQDLIGRVRQADSEDLDVEYKVSLVADQAEYDIPALAMEITSVRRTTSEGQTFPVVRQSKRTVTYPDGITVPPGYNEPFVYIPLPGRTIKLREVPTEAVTDGLVLFCAPYVVRMTTLGLDQAPSGIPVQLHECLVPTAVVRVASYGHRLVDPGAFSAYRQEMERALMELLYPADGERFRDVDEVMGQYEEVY